MTVLADPHEQQFVNNTNDERAWLIRVLCAWESDTVERLKRIEAAAKALLADVRHRYNMPPQAISIANTCGHSQAIQS